MKEKEFNQEEAIANIKAAFDFAQQCRIEGLERMKILHSIKNRALEREKKRLSERLSADHPRIKRIAAKIVYNQDLLKGIDLEIEKRSIRVPIFDKDSWVVHGRVFSADKKGVRGVTVGLFDEAGTWMRQLGYGITDKAGYFFIQYAKKEERQPEITETKNLYIYVSDKEYNILYKDSEHLNIKIGQMIYREIYLPEEEDISRAPEPDKEDTLISPDAWTVKGRVVDNSGRGVSGVTVSLTDRNRRYAERLGSIVTDSKGHFTATYQADQFQDLIKANTGIYIKVLDKNGKTVYASKEAVRFKTGRINAFNITIKNKPK